MLCRHAMSGTLAALALLAAPALADTVTIEPDRDNTLYESAAGNISNGQGVHLFAGRTAMAALRRSLLHFDVAGALPPGAIVTAVELHLEVSKTTVTLPSTVAVHRVLADWGEGSSDAAEDEGQGAFAEPGDATWLNTFYPGAFWSSVGGDFAPAASATTTIGPTGPYQWSGAELVADAQHWLDAPRDNRGWIVLGAEGGGQSSKRFNSRENPDAATRPKLVITYTSPPICAGSWTSYGTGLAGAGGSVPLLAGTGCPEIGAAFSVELSEGLGGAVGALFVGFGPASLPLKGGTFLVAGFVLQVNLLLSGTAGVPAAGALSLPATLPADPVLQGLQVFLQGGLLDPAAVAGISLTNGLRMEIG